MSRETIDFGIDLGTTNSAIAVLNGTTTEILRNNDGLEYAPSAVWIDRKDRIHVGRPAREHLEDDPENAASEFKLQMGTDTDFEFARSGRSMKAEELSSEVLKVLRGDAKQRTGEDIQAAVITVPAAFELPQCDATRKAAEMAGFSLSPLLQEPVAAALAYGFESSSEKVFWLVYDFGGGTFDAAIIQVRDGIIQVVNHGGDNHLGGKLIDWAIVEQLLIPAITNEHNLTDFRRGNPRWKAAFAKLKQNTEKAKIRVSREESAEILIDPLCEDDQGNPIEFEYDLKKADVERLMEPFIVRSINIAKKVLEDKRLTPDALEKIVLVGGPTSSTYLRERLADPDDGLGVPLEFSIDPMTVVARGAAIFAGTQKNSSMVPLPVAAGQFAIELEYAPAGPDTDPQVGGRVSPPEGATTDGHTIEFVNASSHPPWRSGKLPLDASGVFITNVLAEEGRLNTFTLELCDSTGNACEPVPDHFTYKVGTVTKEQPLIHSIGVGLANNQMEWIAEKGAPLPARRRVILRTAFEVRHGKEGDLIRIPVMEGDNERADRNHAIGVLQVDSQNVKRDLPAGSEVEVVVEIDQSRIVRVKAYVPILDEEYEDVLKYESESVDPKQMRTEIENEKQRLDKAREAVRARQDSEAGKELERIERERMLQDVDESYAASQNDPDAAQQCRKRLGDLRSAVDKVEDAAEWPSLVEEAKELLTSADQICLEHGEATDKAAKETLASGIREAIAAEDADLLRKRVEEMRTLVFRMLDRKGIMQVMWFQQICKRQGEMRDQQQATQLIAEGQAAMNNNNIEGLRAVNRQLIELLPSEQPPPDVSTVVR